MHPIKRPKPGESEEELLNQEKEFLAGLKSRNVVPAAKVVKIKKPEPSKPSSSASISTEYREVDGTSTVNAKVDKIKDEDLGSDDNSGNGQVENPFESVLFEVTERSFEPSRLKDFVKMEMPPEALKVRIRELKDEGTSGTPAKRKKSLFAKSFDARRKNEQLEKAVSDTTPESPSAEQTPKPEAIGDKIHPLLAGMTEDEILLEQKKLLERLDPKLVEFIRNRSMNKNGNQPQPSNTCAVSTSATDSTDPMEVDVQSKNEERKITCGDVDDKDLPIDPKSVAQFPGMQKVEKAKLAWAGVVKDIDVPKDENMTLQSGGKNARFDFMGVLLPDALVNDPSTYEKALHNHGEEMERPGYTIEELLTLARSTNMQQRSIALETLANVFSRGHTGIYDEILEKSVFNVMDYMEFIHVIRKGLDNTDANTINAALFCLSSLLHPEHEEACLDATYLWPEARPYPLLVTKPDEVKKDDAEQEMKDFQFLQLDLLDFFIYRTEILTRIQYLLTAKTELLNEKGVNSALKILIRLARHSPNAIICHDKLLRYIVDNHLSANWVVLQDRRHNLKGIPLVHALKLLRILVESSSSNAMKLFHNFSIFPSVMAYIAYDQWREQTHVEEVENLVLEGFKIWLSFLDQGLGIDEYVALFPVLMQFLRFYGLSTELNSFDLHHSAHLFTLLTKIICFGNTTKTQTEKQHSHWELVRDSVSLVEQHCHKIIKVLSSIHLHEKYSTDLALLSLGKGLEFLGFAKTYSNQTTDEAANRLNLRLLTEFCSCRTYIILSENLESHSSILQDAQNKIRYPTNFASINAIKWEGELNPVMRANSPFYFLSHLFSFAGIILPNEAFKTLINSHIEKYLAKIQVLNKLPEECDYFVRFELKFLTELLRILPKEHPLKFPIAYKSLALVPKSSILLFQELLRQSLQTCCDPKDLEAVFQFYLAYFIPESVTTDEPSESTSKSTKVRFDDGGHPGDGKEKETAVLFAPWSTKLAETHWMFHPLENLYKRAVSSPGYVRDNLTILEQEARGCLSFILHCLRHYCDSIIRTSQDLVTVYCRICRVFMIGNPSIYIDSLTIPIMKEILQILVSGQVATSSKKCLFSKRKPSLKAAVSFYDFYSELVAEYFDNSYFNEIFASYLFLPLRASEDENVKRCFWTHQYLQFVRLTSETVSVSIEYLTRDQEKDPKMLELFTSILRRKIISSERNPFLYDVLTRHLKNSVEFMTEELKNDLAKLAIQ